MMTSTTKEDRAKGFRLPLGKKKGEEHGAGFLSQKEKKGKKKKERRWEISLQHTKGKEKIALQSGGENRRRGQEPQQ